MLTEETRTLALSLSLSLSLPPTPNQVLKEETPDLEYYYHLLRPYVHYIPFHFHVPTPNYRLDTHPRQRQPRLDSIVTNLSEVVRTARRAVLVQ